MWDDIIVTIKYISMKNKNKIAKNEGEKKDFHDSMQRKRSKLKFVHVGGIVDNTEIPRYFLTK